MKDERASMQRVRIAVIGSSRVGKSALIVRYLTRRYIGEYHSNTDLLYRQTVPINGTPVELEVIDVSGSNSDKFPAEQSGGALCSNNWVNVSNNATSGMERLQELLQ
uniref:small monomeric GTPase n=1 Tax=Heliothis virescens TaxID=7102 RepID=A0A2A4IZL3_HELVI